MFLINCNVCAGVNVRKRTDFVPLQTFLNAITCQTRDIFEPILLSEAVTIDQGFFLMHGKAFSHIVQADQNFYLTRILMYFPV